MVLRPSPHLGINCSPMGLTSWLQVCENVMNTAVFQPSRPSLYCRLSHQLIQCFSPLHQDWKLDLTNNSARMQLGLISAGPMPGFLPASTETRLKLHATSVDTTKVYPSWCRGNLEISRCCNLHSTRAINFLLLSLQLSVP